MHVLLRNPKYLKIQHTDGPVRVYNAPPGQYFCGHDDRLEEAIHPHKLVSRFTVHSPYVGCSASRPMSAHVDTFYLSLRDRKLDMYFAEVRQRTLSPPEGWKWAFVRGNAEQYHTWRVKDVTAFNTLTQERVDNYKHTMPTCDRRHDSASVLLFLVPRG